MSEDVVLKALHIILDQGTYPLIVMCGLGRHPTGIKLILILIGINTNNQSFQKKKKKKGTVIGCLRKLQRWSLTSIFEEYRRFAGSKVRVLNEQFIELFDTDLVNIPVEHPWL